MSDVGKTGFMDIPCLCIDYCTEESKYVDPDSHFIHIPRDIYLNWLQLKTEQHKETEPLYVAIRNSEERENRLYFGRVEPSVNSSNSNHTMCLLPKWAIDRLHLDDFVGKVDIVYVRQPQRIDYMKVRGNKSSYVKFRDIKVMLESKLSSYNCLNLNEQFHLEDVVFTVTSIKNIEGDDISYGTIHNGEVKIDFELPDDLVEEERLRKEKEDKLRHENAIRGRQIHFGANVHGMTETEEKKSDYKPFQGEGLKMSSTPSKNLSKEELRRLNAERFAKLTQIKEEDI